MKPLSYPFFVTTKGGQKIFQKKELPYFFNPTMWLLDACFCVATLRLESPQTSITAG